MSILNHRQPQWKKFNLKAKAAKTKSPETEAFVKLTLENDAPIFVRPSAIIAMHPGIGDISTTIIIAPYQYGICVRETPLTVMRLIGATP